MQQQINDLANSELQLAKLLLVKQAGQLIGALLLAFCLILLAFAVFTLCAAAAVVALAQCLPTWAACLIVAALYLLMIPVLILASKALFINPVIRKISGINGLQELELQIIKAQSLADLRRERLLAYLRIVKSIYSFLAKLFN